MDNNIHFLALTGSRLYNTNIYKSDQDFFMIADHRWEKQPKLDRFCWTPEQFVDQLFDGDLPSTRKTPGFLSSFCQKSCVDTPIAQYLHDNAEIILQSNMPRYAGFMLAFMQTRIDMGLETHKDFGQFLLYCNWLNKWATKQCHFREAVICDDELGNFIRQIKRQEISIDESYEAIMKSLSELETHLDFFNKPANLDLFYSKKQELIDLFGGDFGG